jgi:hypothetical protein
MRRLATIAVLTFAGAAVAHRLWHRDRPVPASENGHSSDEERAAALRERIAAVHRRLRDEFDSVRGE